jgi:hypothetical protein
MIKEYSTHAKHNHTEEQQEETNGESIKNKNILYSTIYEVIVEGRLFSIYLRCRVFKS